MADKKIILVPYWIAESVHRNQMNLAEVLDFEKLRRFCSPADMAAFLILQTQGDKVIGKPMTNQYNQQATVAINSTGETAPSVGGWCEPVNFTNWNLVDTWLESCRTQEGRDFFYNTVSPLSGDEGLVRSTHERLFTEASKTEHRTEPFHYYDIAPTLGAFVINPGFYTENTSEELQLRTVEAILKALYVYTPQNTVASTHWFRRWLELLCMKRVIVS